MLHISEVSWKRLDTLEGVLNEGDKIKVKLTGTDPKTGKFKLSRKILLPKPEGMREERPREDRPREDRPREGGGQRFDGPRPERTNRPKLERNTGNGGSNGDGQQEHTPQSGSEGAVD